ncbi:MAG TPA: hypothetical protein VKR57_09710 [Terriglobales bacterium]|nr:hypothetical protein [Terriglobales bacterium]
MPKYVIERDVPGIAAATAVVEETKSSRAVRVIYAVLSYALGLWMLLYGMSKIMALQFQVFPSTYVKPLADVSDFFAIAAFFGRFRWFEVLLGFVESIPSILLLFRRTRSIGAILLLGPISFVAITDYAYLPFSYYWDVLAVITGMLIADVGLLLLDQKTSRWIRELFFLNSAPEYRRWQLELASNCILVLVMFVAIYHLGHSLKVDSGEILGFPQINGRGTWDVTTFEIDHKPVDLPKGEAAPLIFFNFDGSCRMNNLPAKIKQKCTADINGRQHTIKLTELPVGDLNAPLQANFQLDGPRLSIHGHSDSHEVSLSLNRHGW